ncbi:hypothetical protein SAMN05660742_12262 [Propionispira arboris]|uniref:Uncharacterized protein n=1 Tax=Propionispira arboris TaxID=84035 RepID=A0A1H7CJQ0_9FIRM|nr:hypothetical protein [Propionispira arboris]SEJ89706.1 hypothetical protein SAMN05660742_12262 [Propionispira arboris]
MDLELIINEASSIRSKAIREGQGSSVLKGAEVETWIGKSILYIEKCKTPESAFYQRFIQYADNAKGVRVDSFDKMLALLESMKEFEDK